jgi:hypothetical protein
MFFAKNKDSEDLILKVYFYFDTPTLSNRSKNVTNRSEIDFYCIKLSYQISERPKYQRKNNFSVAGNNGSKTELF